MSWLMFFLNIFFNWGDPNLFNTAIFRDLKDKNTHWTSFKLLHPKQESLQIYLSQDLMRPIISDNRSKS